MHRTITTIPDVALEKVLSNLTFDEISKCRLVCQKFNQIGGQLLSRGFWQLEKRHHALHKKMRGQLPRRESERRSHPLARHCDILTAIETRLSMLSMTYVKYMETKVCCFIPGKVLDELGTILYTVEYTLQPPRTHELLQELRDISSMAMEHFDEYIVPGLQHKVEVSNASSSTSSKMPTSMMLLKQVFTDEMKSHKKQAKLQKYHISGMLKSLKRLESKCKTQSKLLHRNSRKVKEQARYIEEQETKIKAQAVSIAELKKHVEGWDQKLADLTSELVRAREELLTNSVKPPDTPPQKNESNIKPRVPLKFYDLPVVSDIERKRKFPFTNITPPSPKVPRNLDDNNIANIINKNLTSNISKSTAVSSGMKSFDSSMNRSINSPKSSGFSNFISSSIERIIKNPITSIKSRKRKMFEDLDFA